MATDLLSSILLGIIGVLSAGTLLALLFKNQNEKIKKQDADIEKFDKSLGRYVDREICELKQANMILEIKKHISNEMEDFKNNIMPMMRKIQADVNGNSKKDCD